VERLDHGIDNVAQPIRACLHAPEYAPRRASAHDRNCCGDLPLTRLHLQTPLIVKGLRGVTFTPW